MNWISATTPSIIGIVNEVKTKNGHFKMMNCIIHGIRIYSLYQEQSPHMCKIEKEKYGRI